MLCGSPAPTSRPSQQPPLKSLHSPLPLQGTVHTVAQHVCTFFPILVLFSFSMPRRRGNRFPPKEKLAGKAEREVAAECACACVCTYVGVHTGVGVCGCACVRHVHAGATTHSVPIDTEPTPTLSHAGRCSWPHPGPLPDLRFSQNSSPNCTPTEDPVLKCYGLKNPS